jgi:hypothetical protein
VLYQPPWRPWHVRWFPSEDVSVSLEEADERVFLFRVETRPDHGSLVAITRLEIDDLHLYFF